MSQNIFLPEKKINLKFIDIKVISILNIITFGAINRQTTY